MKIDKESMKKSRKLLNEYHDLEEALDVLSNPDSEIVASFSTFHNHNNKVLKEVAVRLGVRAYGPMREYIETRMAEIINQLKDL